MDCSPPGSSIHEISQARILEWVEISFPRGSSWSRDRTHLCWQVDFFTTKLPGKPTYVNILVHTLIKYYILRFQCSFMWCTGPLLLLVGFLWLWHVEATLRCCGFSYCRAWALGHVGFSSCSLGLYSAVSVVACRLCCSVACGILQDQGWNPGPLHWQVDS